MAFYDDGRTALSAPVSPALEIMAALTSLSVVNGSVVLQRPGIKQQLLVGGTNSDGVLRNLTHTAGTEYAATNLASVATVSPSGEITAGGQGAPRSRSATAR